MRIKSFIFLTSILTVSFSCGVSPALVEGRPSNWSQKIQCADFYNLYSVDENLFRSEQPTKNGMKGLEDIGVKTVLNVRNIRNDNTEGKGVNIILKHFRINTWTISYDEVISALKIIQESPKPVLIHCKHGSDRTGCIVAVYRMAFMGWEKDKAIEEFKSGGYGYHDKAFPNVLRLLQEIDVNELKKSFPSSQ